MEEEERGLEPRGQGRGEMRDFKERVVGVMQRGEKRGQRRYDASSYIYIYIYACIYMFLFTFRKPPKRSVHPDIFQICSCDILSSFPRSSSSRNLLSTRR
jgi:hypothetical protein